MSFCGRRGVVLCAVLLLAGVSCAAGQEMTEAQALGRFERENAQIHALAARVREVRAEARARGVAPNPSVTYTREDSARTRDDFFFVEQALPVNGRLGVLRRAADAAARAAQARADYSVVLLRSEFRMAFSALLFAQEREAQLGKALTDLERILRILREREREGEGSGYDRLRAEREMADARANHVSGRILLAHAQARMAALLALGTDPGALRARGDAPRDGELPPLPELLARALQKRGDLLARQNELETFGHEERAAERLRIPEPVFAAGLKRTNAPGIRDNGYAISVTVPIPIFNRGQNEAERARAAQERTRAEIVAQRQGIAAELRAAYETLRLRRQIAQQYAKDLGQKSADLSRIAELAYQEGEQGILELLDAYRTAVFSRLQALELAWGARQAELELNRAAGEEVIP